MVGFEFVFSTWIDVEVLVVGKSIGVDRVEVFVRLFEDRVLCKRDVKLDDRVESNGMGHGS